MTNACDLSTHPRACVIAQTRYPRPECTGCATGERHLRAAPAPASKPAEPASTTPTGKKEASVATDNTEKVLQRLEKEKRCTKSRLMAFCNVTVEELAEIAARLQKAGKIDIHPGIRPGSMIYTLKGIPKNYAGPEGPEPPPPRGEGAAAPAPGGAAGGRRTAA